jgi:hypothetical protein
MLKRSQIICPGVGAAAKASVHAYVKLSAQNHYFVVLSLY